MDTPKHKIIPVKSFQSEAEERAYWNNEKKKWDNVIPDYMGVPKMKEHGEK